MDQKTYRFRRGGDGHVHFREFKNGSKVHPDVLGTVVPLTARQFDWAIVEPNLEDPVVTWKRARQYREHIHNVARRINPDFHAYMSLYLTDTLSVTELEFGVKEGIVIEVKLYPGGATTNSEKGLTSFDLLFDPKAGPAKILAWLEKNSDKAFIEIHGQVVWNKDGTRKEDVFDRERIFMLEMLPRIRHHYPGLRIELAHISTREAVQAVLDDGLDVFANVTTQHLLRNRNHLLDPMRPDHNCYPHLNRWEDQQDVLGLVCSGNPRVGAGTDGAPWQSKMKFSDCCPGGVFSALNAVELYAQAFWENNGVLDERFENFMSVNLPRFYGIPLSERYITLNFQKVPWTVNRRIHVNKKRRPKDALTPFGYAKDREDRIALNWKTENYGLRRR